MLLDRFSTISQTYMLNEVEAVMVDYDVKIVAPQPPPVPCRRHAPFDVVRSDAQVYDIVSDFRPTLLHSHYFHTAAQTARFAERAGIPFTLRTHSYDVLGKSGPGSAVDAGNVRAVNSEVCAGVLAFPFLRPVLERLGVNASRIIDCFPVVNYRRFHDRSTNGDAVLNVGACLKKKRMQDFVDLGRVVGGILNLYAIGGRAEALRRYNDRKGRPIVIHDAAEPDEMPSVYKAHRWLVYTACPRMKAVGWPMAVAEAQAAGLGVCFPDIRPDVADYVGEAGYLYDSIADVPDVIRRPYPDELREIGFEHAKKSDIDVHKHLLTDIWDRA
jgi:hypothetical protein